MKYVNNPLLIMKLGVLWFYLFALIAHFFQPDGYSILNNNFSQLGPQGYALSFIMQIAFIGSASLWFYGLYRNYKNPVLHKRVSIMFFFIAFFIVIAGVFKTILPSDTFIETPSAILEANIHLFAAHGSQILGLLILIEHIIYSDKTMKRYHMTILILLVLFSIIFEFAPYIGVTQRVLSLTHSFWTLMFLNVYHKHLIVH
jgi:hypothetical protein